MANVASIRADDRHRGRHGKAKNTMMYVYSVCTTVAAHDVVSNIPDLHGYLQRTGAENIGSTGRLAAMLVTPARWPLGMKSWLKYIDIAPPP